MIKRKIMVVSLERQQIEDLHTLFSSPATYFLSATNAGKALQIARLARPDVLLLDIRTPGAGSAGRTFINQCQTEVALKRVQIICTNVDAKSEEDYKSGLLGAGCKGCFGWPINYSNLLERVEACFNAGKPSQVG